jgi:hypothetical protein
MISMWPSNACRMGHIIIIMYVSCPWRRRWPSDPGILKARSLS